MFQALSSESGRLGGGDPSEIVPNLEETPPNTDENAFASKEELLAVADNLRPFGLRRSSGKYPSLPCFHHTKQSYMHKNQIIKGIFLKATAQFPMFESPALFFEKGGVRGFNCQAHGTFTPGHFMSVRLKQPTVSLPSI